MRRSSTVLLLATLATGCVVVKDGDVVADSGTGVVVVNLDSARAAARTAAESAHVATAPTRSATPLPAPAVDARAVTTPPPPASPPSDGGAPAPTSAELSWLAASMIVPVQGVEAGALHDTFDEKRDGTRIHEALDIPAPRGTPVLSATNGTLRRLFTSKAGGLMVYASDASDRFILMYAHLDRYADGMHDDMPLKQGQVIGYVGTTGNAPPDVPHLHFAIARGDGAHWWKGVPVNPYPLLGGR